MSPRWMRMLTRGLVIVLVGVLLYVGYVGFEGSRQLVESANSDRDCRTPEMLFGWDYEAINYDIADDARIATENADLMDCSYLGSKAGDEIVTTDGIRIAGWYVPAADGIGPDGPTVVLVHGFGASKTGILKYGAGLHEHVNLVAFDMRSVGRSTGTQVTAGVLEQRDLRAVIDWVVREKGPSHIGVLGNSLGAATALAEARDDPRVEALVLDSMHTRLRHQVEARVAHGGYPSSILTTEAIRLGAWIRTGVDIFSIDAVDAAEQIGDRPVLLIHGTADNEDLAARTEAFERQLAAAGVPCAIQWCDGSGHNAPAGMPVDVCQTAFHEWVVGFFDEAFGL